MTTAVFTSERREMTAKLQQLVEQSAEKLESMSNRERISMEAAQRISFILSGVSYERREAVKKMVIAAIDDFDSVPWHSMLAAICLLTPADAIELRDRLEASLKAEGTLEDESFVPDA